jgi:hypothetical protein
MASEKSRCWLFRSSSAKVLGRTILAPRSVCTWNGPLTYEVQLASRQLRDAYILVITNLSQAFVNDLVAMFDPLPPSQFDIAKALVIVSHPWESRLGLTTTVYRVTYGQ